jgi:hypothetical protein
MFVPDAEYCVHCQVDAPVRAEHLRAGVAVEHGEVSIGEVMG